MDFLLYILIILIIQTVGSLCLKFLCSFCSLKTNNQSGDLPFFEKLVLSLGLGFPFLFFLVLFVGLYFRFPSPRIIYITLGIISILLSKHIYQNCKDIVQNLLQTIHSFLLCSTILEKFAIVCLAFCIIFNFIGFIVPLTDFDSTVYHFAVPKRYVQAGSIIPVLDMPNSNLPYNIEMLYTFALLLGRERLATLFAFTFSLLLPLVIYVLARKIFSRTSSLLTVGILYMTPIAIHLASYTKNDIAMIFYCSLVFIAFLNWLKIIIRPTANRNIVAEAPSLILMGIFSGLAFGTKLTSIFLIGSLFFVFFCEIISKRRYCSLGGIFLRLAIVGFFSTLVFFPWLLKTYCFTGRLYAHNKQIEGIDKSGQLIFKYNKVTEKHMKKNLRNYLCFPWNITMHEMKTGFWKYSISPVFLMFVPLLLFLRQKKSRENENSPPNLYSKDLDAFSLKNKVINISLFCALSNLTIVFIILTEQWSRYNLSTLIPLALCAVCAFQELSKKNRFLKVYLTSLLIVIFCGNTGLAFAFAAQRIPVAVGLENRDTYLLKQVPFYKVYKFANKHIPANDKVLIMYLQTYYLDRNFLFGEPSYQTTAVNFFKIKNQQQLYNRLKKIEIKWLIIHKDFIIKEANALNPRSTVYAKTLKLIKTFTPAYFEKVYEFNNVFIYRVVN